MQKSKKIKGLAALFIALLLTFGAVALGLANTPCAVAVNGKVLAVAENKGAAEEIVNSLITEKQRDLPNAKPMEKISYKRTLKGSNTLASRDELRRALAENLTFMATAAGISIDGEVKLAVKDRAAAQQVLDKIKQSYQEDPDYSMTFRQKVEMVDTSVPADKVLDIEEAVNCLRGGSHEHMIYTVQEGDNLWDIATKYDLDVEELQSSNPGLTPETMQIGQEIKLAGALQPLVDVVATAEKTVQEDIILASQVKKNPNLPYGQSKVLQEGEKGLKEVIYQVVAVNGLETQRTVKSEKILKEAKPQIVERSSQTMVASRGLSRPSGRITSGFGMRWGKMHKGVDIGLSYGTPVQAAQAGTVTRAGSFGAYGLCVDINHGNGVTTRYAHMSSISVKVGQKVTKGQQVGKVGSTGRSTGPHLHFEKLVNGVAVNPLG